MYPLRKRSMTLSVPDCAEVNRLRMSNHRKMSLGNAPLIANGRPSPPPRRTSLAESIRTLAFTARRNSSPLYRKSTKKLKKSRLVGKNGICNVYNTNVPKKDRQYLRDIFTTLIDVKWRWMLLLFASAFVLSWSVFGTTYYLIALFHGDLTDPLPANHTACVVNLDSVYSSFLFAVETHHTIGYGHRYITTECYLAGVIVCLQAICALLLQSFMVGIVFAKMARPKKRAETIIFSDKAVICLRDGQLCFLCRVGDMRNTHLVEAHVRLQFITDRETNEGEIEPLHQFEMKVGPSISDDDRLFLVWPTTLCHVIDSRSPLYNYNQQSLMSAQFEIIVLLEGIVESTGMTAQAKTSYLPSEISWGHRFRKLVTYQRSNGSYQIDYDLFNSTYPVRTPAMSPAEFYSSKPNLKDYYCHDSQEHKLEDNRSSDSTPLPSPSPYSYPSTPMNHFQSTSNSPVFSNAHSKFNTEAVTCEAGMLCPPTIVVQCPSTCASPNHMRRTRNQMDKSRTSSSCDLTRPSTALSDLEEECSDSGSPTKCQSPPVAPIHIEIVSET
ncbi:hypothetical protein L5515_018107 [Caenorhabditis briggsae]|uniref:Protein CBR-IRK-1 n=1 Tax=Caenorhabditis briggsae TaxID=6238 RepID=A0AAE9FFL6_CAEBR|nr:hypothetical protein L5515_018107 [Caenorhabditis briggsae]